MSRKEHQLREHGAFLGRRKLWPIPHSARGLAALNSCQEVTRTRRRTGLLLWLLFGLLHGNAVASTQVVSWGGGSGGRTNVPPDLTNSVVVSGGWRHSIALRADGTVVAWGTNDSGQTSVPPDLEEVVAVSAGRDHNLALKRDGTIVAWGLNDFGQTSVPSNLANVVAIAAGGKHSLALTEGGVLVGWGRNDFGQSSPPSGLTNIVAISAGYTFSMALEAEGKVVTWGHSGAGNAVDYPYTNMPPDLTNVVAIAAGYFHRIALRSDGTVAVWGSEKAVTPMPPGLSNVIAVAAGHPLSVVLRNDGTVVLWGDPVTTTVPPDLPRVTAIGAGRNHVLALVGEIPDVPVRVCGNRFSSSFTVFTPTAAGWTYALESIASLTETNWVPVSFVWGSGYGVVRSLVDMNPPDSSCFYRVKASKWVLP
jgi:alpha-tubulin suppressor-like RCC1 family protein